MHLRIIFLLREVEDVAAGILELLGRQRHIVRVLHAVDESESWLLLDVLMSLHLLMLGPSLLFLVALPHLLGVVKYRDVLRSVKNRPLDVIDVVIHDRHRQDLIGRVHFVRDLALPDQQVFLHVLQGLQSEVHVYRRYTLGSVSFRVEVEVLFHFKFVNGLAALFARAVFNALSFDLELDACQLRLEKVNVLSYLIYLR